MLKELSSLALTTLFAAFALWALWMVTFGASTWGDRKAGKVLQPSTAITALK